MKNIGATIRLIIWSAAAWFLIWTIYDAIQWGN